MKKEDVERLGYGRDCGGCSSWFKGRARQPHTQECRERFRKLMAEEARVQYAAEKRREFDEKMEDKARKKLARKGGTEGEGGYAQVGDSSSSMEARGSGTGNTTVVEGYRRDGVDDSEVHQRSQVLVEDMEKVTQAEKRGVDDFDEGARNGDKKVRLIEGSIQGGVGRN